MSDTQKLILIFMQEQLPTDLVRVDTLFQKSHDAGINIEVQTILLNA